MDRIRAGEPLPGFGYEFWPTEILQNLIPALCPQSYADLISLDSAVSRRSDLVLESFYPNYWQRVAPMLLRALAYDYETAFSHRTLNEARFLFKLEDGLFVHLGLVPSMLRAIWKDLDMDGAVAQGRGNGFERYLSHFVSSKQVTPIWPLSKPIPFPCGKREKSDADLVLAVGPVGIVVSCKSWKAPMTEDGDQREAWLRWTEVQVWVRENDELASTIAKHASELDLPATIEVLVPVVCVPAVEYVWDISPNYMLNGTLPRVLTPTELADWAQKVTMEEALSLPFTVRVPST
jgi:hypothetical protein